MYVDVLNFDKINNSKIPTMSELGKKRRRRKHKLLFSLSFITGVNGHCQKLKYHFKNLNISTFYFFSILRGIF